MSFRYAAPGKPIGFLIAREPPACGRCRQAGSFVGHLLLGQFIALAMTCLPSGVLWMGISREELSNG